MFQTRKNNSNNVIDFWIRNEFSFYFVSHCLQKHNIRKRNKNEKRNRNQRKGESKIKRANALTIK